MKTFNKKSKKQTQSIIPTILIKTNYHKSNWKKKYLYDYDTMIQA